MRFVSRIEREPFANLNARKLAMQTKAMSQKAEERLQTRKVKPERLAYNYETGGIIDTLTGKYYTGKVIIPADKFERVIKVSNGMEVCSMVRLNNGKIVYADIVGNKPKYFKTDLSPAAMEEETEKMLAADQLFYDDMVKRFTKMMQ